MLNGGETRKPDFDQAPLANYFPRPEDYDAFMRVYALPDPEMQGAKPPAWSDVRREEKAGRLMVLEQMAMNDPEAWRCLLREVEELQVQFERLAGKVKPEDDPVARHGKQCYTSGMGAGLGILRNVLQPDSLSKAVKNLTEPELRRTQDVRGD